MIDALFGSKTRVKLLHLFLNNPTKSFYVREITRLIDEQINSVRRELANMVEVGIISSDNADNKLYYQVNQRYEFYLPFRAIFADEKVEPLAMSAKESVAWHDALQDLKNVTLAVAAGVLVDGSKSPVDLLIVGAPSPVKLKRVVAEIEAHEGREVNYTLLPHNEFYYRLSVHDKFIMEIINNKHVIITDPDGMMKQTKEK